MKRLAGLILTGLLFASSAYAEVELRRQKNLATKYLIGIRNSATGALIAGASGLDTECDGWADGTNPDGFTDATNEATEVGSTGIYYVTLTAAEVNFDYIVCQTKSTSTNAMTTIVFINTIHGTVLTNASGQLSTGTIVAGSFGAGAIDASAIAADAIGASEIATDAIGAAEVAADAIGASEVAANAITATEFADDTITAAKIAADAIGASEMATDAIGAAELASNAITSSEIANASLTSAKFGYDGALASESGTTLGLASGAVDADDQFNNGFALVVYDSGGLVSARSCISDSTNSGDTVVTANDISALVAVADNYIIQPDAGCTAILASAQTTNITGNITGNLSGSVGSVTGAVGSVTAVSTGAITAASFGSGAIDATAIAANAITSSEIADGAIDAGALAADTITAAKIADGAITATEIADGAIDAATLAADTITAAKIDSTANTEIENTVWNALLSGHTTAGSYGQALQVVRTGTAQAGGGTSITLDAGASATTDFYKYQIIQIVGGTGAGQGNIITAYNGATKVATVGTWGTNPDNTSVFVIRPFGAVPGASAPTAADVADAVWDELHSGHLTAGSFGEYLDAKVSEAGGSASNVRKW